jgi:hypothetical protein
VQIKAVSGPTVSIDIGTIDYGYWQDHQPSGASTMHTNVSGETVTRIDGGAGAEFQFIVRCILCAAACVCACASSRALARSAATDRRIFFKARCCRCCARSNRMSDVALR